MFIHFNKKQRCYDVHFYSGTFGILKLLFPCLTGRGGHGPWPVSLRTVLRLAIFMVILNNFHLKSEEVVVS
jgi:hypothetical protein